MDSVVETEEVGNVVVVVEEESDQWAPSGEVESGDANVDHSSVVVDFNKEFNHIFRQSTFDSFNEFQTLFNKFKAETGTVFRIKSSCSVEYENRRRKRHFVPARFKFVSVRYCCVHYGQPKTAGQGIRNKQKYLPCGCECLLSLSYSRGALVIAQAVMQHNHEVNSKTAPYYAINRRISTSELKQVSDLIENFTTSRQVQRFLQTHFHRPITLQDAKNTRARLKALKMRQEERFKDVKYVPEKPECVDEYSEVDKLQVNEETIENVRKSESQEDSQPTSTVEEEVEERDPYELIQVQEQLKYNLLDKLSDSLTGCETPVFFNRIGIISKIIECWENGEHFEVQYGSKSNCDKETDGELGHIKFQTQENSHISNKTSEFSKKIIGINQAHSTIETLNIQQPSLTDQSLRQSLKHGTVPHLKDIDRTKKCISEKFKYRSSRESHNSEKVQLSIEHEVQMCDEATEVEIEVNGNVANIRQVKLEPLEYYEVNIAK